MVILEVSLSDQAGAVFWLACMNGDSANLQFDLKGQYSFGAKRDSL
jgi:hypothetical protein